MGDGKPRNLGKLANEAIGYFAIPSILLAMRRYENKLQLSFLARREKSQKSQKALPLQTRSENLLVQKAFP